MAAQCLKNKPYLCGTFYCDKILLTIHIINRKKDNLMKNNLFKLTRAAVVLLLVMLGSVGAWAEDVVTIGKAQYSADLPLTAQYKYALSQQVFSAQEISHAKGKIWSIAFLTENGDLTRNYTVYLTHTDQSSLSSYSWQPVTEADCVFSGEVTFTSRQWNTIYFDKPFEYDGVSNIVVTVDDNTGVSGNWGALTNFIFYGDGNHAIARDNNKDIDPLNATSIDNANQKNTFDYKLS